MIYQAQIGIGSLPVNLILLSTGQLVFIRVANIGVLFDNNDGIDAVFMDDGFRLNDEEFSYNTLYWYKEIPLLLQWLKNQNLQEPY